MNVEMVQDVDTTPLDAALLDNVTGRVRLMRHELWRQVDPLQLRLWCRRHARYGIPTTGLVNWLREFIDGRRAIEVGAGMGDLGFHLGIPMSDNASQTDEPMAAAYFALTKQPPTRPPLDVVRLEAVEAVLDAGPGAVVIASWLTQKYKPGDAHGCMFGPDEDELLDIVLDGGGRYVHIGNEAVHGDKRILKRRHDKLRLPFLISRASRPDLDVVYVF